MGRIGYTVPRSGRDDAPFLGHACPLPRANLERVRICARLRDRLISLGTHDALLSHAKVGSSWEGFVLEQVIRRLRARPEECFFWRTHTGAELDLLVVRGQRRLGFEMKRTSSPSMSPSMRSALDDLKLDTLTVVHAGQHTFPLDRRVRAVALRDLLGEIRPLS